MQGRDKHILFVSVPDTISSVLGLCGSPPNREHGSSPAICWQCSIMNFTSSQTCSRHEEEKDWYQTSVTIFSIFQVQGWVEALWHTVLSALKVHHHFWAAAGVTKLNTLWNKVLLLDVTSPSKWHPVIFLKSQTSKFRRFILPGLRHSYEESSAWFRDILMPVDRSTDQHLSGYRKIQYTVYLYIVYYILIQKYKYTVKHFEDSFVFS